MFSSIFGPAYSGIMGNAQQASPLGLANQQSNTAQAQLAAQQQVLYTQALGNMFAPQKRYMINGRAMTFEQWLDELAPGEDNSLRTFLILKYKDSQ